MAVGAAMGALAGSMADVGIDDDFIRGVRDNVTPGTSALFVMSSNAVADKVLEEFKADRRNADLHQSVEESRRRSCARPSLTAE